MRTVAVKPFARTAGARKRHVSREVHTPVRATMFHAPSSERRRHWHRRSARQLDPLRKAVPQIALAGVPRRVVL